jgi:hypothetical protein
MFADDRQNYGLDEYQDSDVGAPKSEQWIVVPCQKQWISAHHGDVPLVKNKYQHNCEGDSETWPE